MGVVQRTRAPEAANTETAENPRVKLGANRPPLDAEAKFQFDDALDAKEGFRDRVESLIGAADRAVATDEETAGRCGELVKQIRAATKFVEDTHKLVKQPYLDAGRAVDAAKNELCNDLDAAKRTVEGKQTVYLREQEAIRMAELRRQREAEEALRREEYERQKKLAETLAAAEPSSPPVEVAPPAPVQVAEPERQIIRGDYGAAVSGTKVWLHQIVDIELAFMAVSNNEKVRDAIDKAIGAMVRGGVRQIDGVCIWSDVKASNR